MKKTYIRPDMAAVRCFTGSILAGTEQKPITSDPNARAKGTTAVEWNDDDEPEAVGSSAGSGKSALELPSQNKKIWGD